MMKKILVAGAMALTLPVAAAPGAATPDTVEVKSILYYSPLPVKGPVMIDSVDIKDKKIDRASALLKRMPRFSDQPTADAAPATTPLQTEVAGLGFSLENRSFAKARIPGCCWRGDAAYARHPQGGARVAASARRYGRGAAHKLRHRDA